MSEMSGNKNLKETSMESYGGVSGFLGAVSLFPGE